MDTPKNGAIAMGAALLGSTFIEAFVDKALFGETLAIVVSKPKNSFTESMNPKPEPPDALALITSVMPMTRLNTTVRINVDCDEFKWFDIINNFK